MSALRARILLLREMVPRLHTEYAAFYLFRTLSSSSKFEQHLRDDFTRHVGGNAGNPRSIHTLHDVIVGLPVRYRAVHVSGLGDGRGIQLLIRCAAAG